MNNEAQQHLARFIASLQVAAGNDLGTSSENGESRGGVKSINDGCDENESEEKEPILSEARICSFISTTKQPTSAVSVRKRYPVKKVSGFPKKTIPKNIAAAATKRKLHTATELKADETLTALFGLLAHMADMVRRTTVIAQQGQEGEADGDAKDALARVIELQDKLGIATLAGGSLAFHARKPIRQRIDQVLGALPGYTLASYHGREEDKDSEFVLNPEQLAVYNQYQIDSQHRRDAARPQYSGNPNGRGRGSPYQGRGRGYRRGSNNRNSGNRSYNQQGSSGQHNGQNNNENNQQ
ncbi:hypothetical protein GGI11_000874 [Coemansia sp. RSA 2049]|nr:hypothetical protein H4217_004082 [Coemansia sp. RSA 1939]KAJ2524368.1 hypothetical protein GGI11_000874 [Coemansia sp. RSA 2049]KAJ2693877.1 hypothetical protein GGH99_000946 [Coemansia sp. RSA 1285]